MIAREVLKKHRRSEEEFLELCGAYPSDTVARHPFAYLSQQVYADLEAEAAAKNLGPNDAEFELQRAERSGSMRLGTDGSDNVEPTRAQLTADAISDLIAGVAKARQTRTNRPRTARPRSHSTSHRPQPITTPQAAWPASCTDVGQPGVASTWRT